MSDRALDLTRRARRTAGELEEGVKTFTVTLPVEFVRDNPQHITQLALVLDTWAAGMRAAAATRGEWEDDHIDLAHAEAVHLTDTVRVAVLTEPF